MPAKSLKQLKIPTPKQIKAARSRSELTQSEAAALVHLGAKSRWAEYENGTRPIDLARWELFLIKIGELRLSTSPRRTS